jgi:hypothetical protein
LASAPRGSLCCGLCDEREGGGWGTAQVRFHTGVPEASVDDEGVPEEQPARLNRLTGSPGSPHLHVRLPENAALVPVGILVYLSVSTSNQAAFQHNDQPIGKNAYRPGRVAAPAAPPRATGGGRHLRADNDF